jgi:hypothetical protein
MSQDFENELEEFFNTINSSEYNEVPLWQLRPIVVRKDGSYVIKHAVGEAEYDYHVPPGLDEFKELFLAVDAFAKEYPDRVKQEIIPEPVPLTEEEVRAAKLAEITSKFEAALAPIIREYPASERLTFELQEAEARAYVANNAVQTPLLTALAQARGIPLEELALKVIEKADTYKLVAGTLIGQRQAYTIRLNNAVGITEILEIEVIYGSQSDS